MKRYFAEKLVVVMFLIVVTSIVSTLLFSIIGLFTSDKPFLAMFLDVAYYSLGYSGLFWFSCSFLVTIWENI